jgi:hypothetical protein
MAQNSLVSCSLEDLSVKEDEDIDSQHEVIKDVAGMVFLGKTKIIVFFYL